METEILSNSKTLIRNPQKGDKQNGSVVPHNWDNIIYNHKVVGLFKDFDDGLSLCRNAQYLMALINKPFAI